MRQPPRHLRKTVEAAPVAHATAEPVDCTASFLSPADRVVEHPETVIDLLNASPAQVLDDRGLKRALSFAFSGGFTVDAIRGAMSHAKIEPSEFDPKCFREGLFVDELIDTCMKVRMAAFEPAINKRFLTKLLVHPPKDCRVIEFRRAVLRELTEEARLREAFRETYQRLYTLRGMFESDERFDEHDNKRRIEMLGALRDAVARMASDFKDCKSGLARISTFAAHQLATEGFAALEALLDFDDHLAGVDLTLRIGRDGRINRLEIVSMRENSANRFHRSPLRRFLARIQALLRGYAFSDGELINRLVDSVYEGVENLMPAVVRLLAEMEFYLASLALKDLAESKGLEVSLPELCETADGPFELEGLFNPLLFAQHITPVPCTLASDRRDAITVVTGPNSGGKTRLLQAVATVQLLAECGMYAPVARARIHRTAGLFLSLIEEARADQREGRLGTELIRIRSLFEQSRPASLVVLDELCSGTNPSEGEEIFRLVVSLLSELKPRVFITTHFLQFAASLAAEAGSEPPLRFLQVELDETDHPTYQFVPGVASTSLAHLTAARLGVTREELLALIRRHSNRSP